MATPLDFQEQEQLDNLKAFWARYGNLITLVLVLAFGALAAWNGWNWWQREQAVKAAALYDQLDAAATAGDTARATRVFDDLKDRFAGTVLTAQGGLLAAKLQYDKGDMAAAESTLGWLAEHAADDAYRTLARLRLAGVRADAKRHDDALKALDGADAPAFAGLVADRRGDILLAQGKRDEARDAYRKAWDALAGDAAYRGVVEAKLTALGAAPTPSPAASVAALAAASGASR